MRQELWVIGLLVGWGMASALAWADQPLTVLGTAHDPRLARVTVNGTEVTPEEDGTFSATITLKEEGNEVTVVATDEAGNSSSVTRTVTLDTTPPELIITFPEPDAVFGPEGPQE